MRCGDYIIELDKTGFPLVKRKEWNFFISLFPISKYQFENFLADVGTLKGLYTDEWYRQLLDLNPRLPWQKAAIHQTPWRLFITGIPVGKVHPFLRYLGNEYRLPREKEWLKLLNNSDDLKALKDKLMGCLRRINQQLARPVFLWIKKGIYPLVKEGILEIINVEKKAAKDEVFCLGCPWQGLWPNTWDSKSLKTINFNLRPEAIGFRVIKECDSHEKVRKKHKEVGKFFGVNSRSA